MVVAIDGLLQAMGCCKRWVATRYRLLQDINKGLLQEMGCYKISTKGCCKRWVVTRCMGCCKRWVVAEDWLLQGTACIA